jgi:hypothetical protein
MNTALTTAADLIDAAPGTDLIDAIRYACTWSDPMAQFAINELAAHLGHPDGDHERLRQWQRDHTGQQVVAALHAAAG